MVAFFLSTRLYFSGVTLNLLVNARVTLKIFTLKSVTYAVSVHVTKYNLPYILWYPFQFPRGNPVIVFLFPVLNNVFTFRRFVIFFRLFFICDVDPESATNICSISLLIFCFARECVIAKENLVIIYIFSDISFFLLFLFFIFLFLPEYLFFVTLLVIWRVLLPILLIVVTFFNGVYILFAVHTMLVLCFFFLYSPPKVFLDMSRFVAVMKFWYVFTLFIPALFSFVPVFSASLSGTFLLLFYVMGFSSFLEGFWSFMHSVKFHRNFVTDPLNS